MPQRIYAIMGATGQIGQNLVQDLLKRDHVVRAIGRDKRKLAWLEEKGAKACPAAFDDAAALAQAFEGASAVFAMIPPAYEAEDFSAHQDRTGEAIATALKQAKTTHVVNLSSIGAQWPNGTGPITGLHRQEMRLNSIPGLNVLHLRPGYFMENQLWSIPIIKQKGVNGSPIRGDLQIQMVTTRDIGARTATLLDRLEFTGTSVVEFVGPKPLTLNEATKIMGSAISKPYLKYVQIPYEEAATVMAGLGLKPSIIELMIEMDKAMNDNRIVPQNKPSQGTTSFEEFARIFAQAYRVAEAAPAQA